MKAFEELTRVGKARRLREVAIHALAHYDLDVVAVRLAGMHTNALYRAHTTAGASFLLRVCRPGWRTDNDLISEALWLQALGRDTDIGAPVPMPARNGGYLVEAAAKGVPDPRRCFVMSWIPGAPLAGRLGEENLYKMGILFARLHEHGARFRAPTGFTERRMDSVFARQEEVVLFGALAGEETSDRTRTILERTWERVQAGFEALYSGEEAPRVIHHDLWHGNIKVHRGRLLPLDFEDTAWGYPVQDIAMALQDLMLDVSPEGYDPLSAAFRRGYESWAVWPEMAPGQIDLFRAGRMFWVANYVARCQAQYLGEHLEWVAGLFERFLESGRLRKG
jgi:Ser/Thr protein kinase RdoA (MazF antagonist)